jgi:hypothetical protein
VSDSQIQSCTVVCSLYSRITAARSERHCAFLWPGSAVEKLFIHSVTGLISAREPIAGLW